MKKIYYYNSFQDNFVESKKQDYNLKKGYKWIHKNVFYKIFSFFFNIFVVIFSFIYSKFYLRVKIKNKKILKKEKGYFLYSNHTQMIGDALNPFMICFPKHPFIICASANLGIPIIGKLLPIAGALPIPDNIHDMIKFKDSIFYYINKGKPIVIYPEGHLWPWATFIRDFPKASFHYPVESKKKVFVATTTYSKSKIFKRPKITIYIDGPFQNDEHLSKRENINYIHDSVYKTMVNRSKLSNYEYVIYKKNQD